MNSGRRKKGSPPDSREETGGQRPRDPPPTDPAFESLEQAYRRLDHLYEISKLFASFESVTESFDPALGIVAKSLPLRSAILIQTENGQSRMIVWPSELQDSERLRAVKEHAEASYAYLVGAKSTESLGLSEQPGKTLLPPQEQLEGDEEKRFIVIPLVVAQHSLFGALQLEGAFSLEKKDLVFVNAIANQLAIALERDRAWRKDITRREDAEEERARAEARGAVADRGRLVAESSSEKYEALARENAQLYKQAQVAVKEREQILRVVSHDLKSPLSTILMTTGALAPPGAGGRRRTELPVPKGIERIQRAAERMMRLIEDLLDFASIERGHLSIKRQPNDAASLVNETLASFERVAQEQRLKMTAEVEPSLPPIYCDKDRILQVLSNLVGNATKITAEGGSITLTVEARARECVFTVTDTGPGIRREDLKHLFDRYWRSDEARYEGLGLGLAISSGIIDEHGGRIWVESERGHGATFRFTVPLVGDAGTVATP
ncbi:GAF domain-containing sensor histidine kinase [Myxococcus qinghaiensis]|uniref:GAF domain-containing sensor histidine kinase n=1 Tax=Myxococcus qinghaiensis TaxID=2906758 RepID=UPI0020A804D0|nr:HAMP domain-containing sensor histidine kinase [Myxococcus qinghaiensis]MCP3168685.1 HAMP domain-containing histidine kinase [Myxococcus qinghaiensis]